MAEREEPRVAGRYVREGVVNSDTATPGAGAGGVARKRPGGT